jgi:hypothetical protein
MNIAKKIVLMDRSGKHAWLGFFYFNQFELLVDFLIVMCKIMLELQLARGGMKACNRLGFQTKFRAKNVHDARKNYTLVNT